MFPDFLVFVCSILVIVRRSTGPDFDEIFEVPKTIQEVLNRTVAARVVVTGRVVKEAAATVTRTRTRTRTTKSRMTRPFSMT